MKNYRYIIASVCGALALGACSDIDEQLPAGGTLLDTQLQETNTELPARASASFTGMFTPIGKPNQSDWDYANDLGLLVNNMASDCEGADVILPDSGYNWFNVCGQYSSRNPDYAVPFFRYSYLYNEITRCNDFIKSLPALEEITDQSVKYMVANAYALRAWCYLTLAPMFQFGYTVDASAPSVPVVTTETVDFTNNPRASLSELYDLIISDLTTAVDNLEGYQRISKMYVDKNVAHGLRARAYLNMGRYAEAAADANAARQGYTPASIADVSKPYFMDINEPNWLWGYDMTKDIAEIDQYATMSAWMRSFSANSYSAGVGTYCCINNALWAKIPSTDVRKGWWVDENLKSPLLDGLSWGDNPDVANAVVADEKTAFLPYTNVKFGCYKVATVDNEEDFPLMRAEEMYLVEAEALYKSGKTAEATSLLTEFVQTYRDPQYNVNGRNLSFEDEVWFQRRVELWGEGFFENDRNRLNKPLVRFTDLSTTNWPSSFAFNMPADDGYLLMRFPQNEMDTNYGVVQNTAGDAPKSGQNSSLRDGVTD